MRRIVMGITLALGLTVFGFGCDSGSAAGTDGDVTTGEDTAVTGCEPTDPCCDGSGVFLPAGDACLLGEESVCSSDECGGAPVTRQIFGQCPGDLGLCGGVPSHGPWTSLEVCGWDAVCDPESRACIPGVCEVETC